MKQDAKRETVFEAAATLFAQYGFRRASMSEIAAAAGISRPTLYAMFDNKETLFRQLANHRQNQAIDEAAAVLAEDAPVADRVTRAILAYERIYYEPVAGSPHGAEFMDLNNGAALQDMIDGRNRLIVYLSGAIAAAQADAPLPGAAMPARDFAELLMLSINGLKKAASSIEEFRQKIREVSGIFMASITSHTQG
ncbi:TetR/AcrR family transcriptional regulator [Sphingomonas sp. 28-62-11]|uniref:TetR/AcrR family transcriptional regulator n=1 Tax=Sphingomonas sp. 28-62-11 TaxID=1970432 RepID=UPI0035A836A3